MATAAAPRAHSTKSIGITTGSMVLIGPAV